MFGNFLLMPKISDSNIKEDEKIQAKMELVLSYLNKSVVRQFSWMEGRMEQVFCWCVYGLDLIQVFLSLDYKF